MLLQNEIDIIVKGIELSWITWGKMRGEKLVLDDISYVKAENGKGFERIFSVKIENNQEFRVKQMISLIKAGVLPDAMLIMPDTKPANLAEILSSRGFTINDKDPCMILYMDKYEPKNLECPDLEIIKIKQKNQLVDYLNILNLSIFGCELITADQFSDVLALENVNIFLGFINGKPVTGCMTIKEGDTSVLEMVATLKEYRGKGYASAVIDKALTHLYRNGIKAVSLRAEPDGVGVYKRFGFKESFKRVVASCDWDNIYKKSCFCHIDKEKVEKIKRIFYEINNIENFVCEMKRQSIIGRDISYNAQENSIYITKKYSCDTGTGCPSNNTLIGQRCHCEYVSHLTVNIPISYCNCCGFFYEQMFSPLFGNNIHVEPVRTALSGSDECVFKIKLFGCE